MLSLSLLSRTCKASRLGRGATPSLANRTVVAVACDDSRRVCARAISSSSSSGADSGIDASSGEPTLNVAFVGLGNMGLRMALNLARSRSGVVDDAANVALPPLHLMVYDLHQSNITSFFKHAETMEDIMSSSSTTLLSAASDLVSLGESNPDFVITSLPTCGASELVVGDIVKSLPMKPTHKSKGRGCTFVDTSTISPSISKKLHQLVKSMSPHNDYVDAPVSGGVKGASDASLTFMVGCSSTETFSSIQPLLHRMGKRIIPCGGPGSGSAVKLCNNTALAAQMVSTHDRYLLLLRR
jgi:3-hydroxyisobutyrate dehydrogenase-like beta-hydroxyacid dehydrogenase